LGRIGLFLGCALVLWPLEMNILVKLMIAVLASAGLAYILLRPWRDQMAEQLAAAAARRRAEKERLRSALAGEDRPPADNPPAEDDRPPAEDDRPPAEDDRPPAEDDRPDDGTPR
jgi:hypothetical protein